MATILAAFERHRQRLSELKPRVLVGEFGGAAGTLSSLGKDGLKVQDELMKELKLGQPEISWHTVRDRIAGGRLLPRPRHRQLRQDRLRRKAVDADRGRGSLRTLPRRPRLVLDHAAETQPDFVCLHHRTNRNGAPAGCSVAGRAGGRPRAVYRPVGNRMDRATGNFHACPPARSRRRGSLSKACRSTRRKCARIWTSPRA